jgi:hypothetical protein
MTHKTCSKCRKHKPFSAFYSGRGRYGLTVWCRKCNSAYAREKRANDKAALAIIRERNQYLPSISNPLRGISDGLVAKDQRLVSPLLSVFRQIDQMRR